MSPSSAASRSTRTTSISIATTRSIWPASQRSAAGRVGKTGRLTSDALCRSRPDVIRGSLRSLPALVHGEFAISSIDLHTLAELGQSEVFMRASEVVPEAKLYPMSSVLALAAELSRGSSHPVTLVRQGRPRVGARAEVGLSRRLAGLCRDGPYRRAQVLCSPLREGAASFYRDDCPAALQYYEQSLEGREKPDPIFLKLSDVHFSWATSNRNAITPKGSTAGSMPNNRRGPLAHNSITDS